MTKKVDMARLDFNALLTEISTESPCGDDYSYKPAFGEMERAAKGKAAQQIGNAITSAEESDWSQVQVKAVDIFQYSKDLRVAVYLTQALLHNQGLHKQGFRGLSDGLALIKLMLNQYWESVHPQLDFDENNDPTERVNALVSLCDGRNIEFFSAVRPV
ncbi:MAG: ImpA family type VI secretion system protein [Thiohalomonadales bacterium]